MTRLVLIRHGITAWNKQKRYCGRKDISLSRQGRLQAKRLSRRLEAVKFDKIYSSDRKRAFETCRIIFNKARITRVSALGEINFGALEGLRHKEIIKKYGDVYKKWLADPFQNNIPGAESMFAFKKRVDSAIKKIACRNPGKNLAIVCHGGVVGIFVSGILKNRNFWRYVPAPTSLTVVEYEKEKFRLKQFNQVQGRFSTQS